MIQRGRAPAAAQYDSIASCAVGASSRSTMSTGSSCKRAGIDDVGRREAMSRRHGDVVDGHLRQWRRREPAWLDHRSAHDAGGERTRAQTVEDAQ